MFSKKNIIIFSFIAIVGALLVLVFTRVGKNFIATEEARKTFGEETKVQREFIPLTEWGKRDTSKRRVFKEDFIVKGGVETFQDTEFLQTGNIIVEGTGTLVFRNSVVKMTPGRGPRANIFVRDEGKVLFENSTLKPSLHDPANLYVNLADKSRFTFNNSQGIHMLIAGGSSGVEINNSIWAFYLPTFRGGGVQLTDSAQADIKDSVIGGLVLDFPKEALIDVKNFKPQKFSDFNLQRDFSAKNVGFNIILKDTEILGDYYEGGSERGLSIFSPSDITSLKVSNSELNKLVIKGFDEYFSFRGLELSAVRDFVYKNINFANSKVMAQWGFFMRGGSGTFTDSEGLWFFLYDDAKLTLKDSEMNEFDPRNFSGVIDFDNVIWKNAGEIIANNDFIWRGEWSAQGFDSSDFRPLIWDESKVKREFSIDIMEIKPEPAFVRGAKIEVFDKNNALLSRTYTDKSGRAYFSINFDDENYRDIFSVKVIKGEREREHPIKFLTATPIKLILR